MARVLVTGGAGFIGSHLVDALVELRHQVVVVDNLSTGKRRNVSSRADFIRADIRSPRLQSIWRKARPEYVFHLAAQKNVRISAANPLFDADVNIAGSLNVIEQSRRFRARRLIFSSTAGVYPDARRLPIRETLQVAPASPYGISKYMIELYLRFFAHQSNLSSVSLRYANVYGPRQDANGEAGVIAIFFQQLANRKPLWIHGHGRQTRDYVYVGDTVRANILAMNNLRATGEMNIGTGTPTTVNALAQAMMNVTGLKSPIRHRPVVSGEAMNNALSWSLAKQRLQWKPEVKLDRGLHETWQWAKGVLR